MDDQKLFEILGLDIIKYPRTPHLQGSKNQKGDEGYDQVPYAMLQGHYIVVEEKFDGANSGISFSQAGEQLLQSRGHYLTGGGRERQFNLFKQWAVAHENWLIERLEDRYVMYGEWCHKKHTVWYDRLPHYFLEFDVLSKQTGKFLSTAARRKLLQDGPVLSVRTLYEGLAPRSAAELKRMLLPSFAKSRQWRDALHGVLARERLDEGKAWSQTDKSDLSEGLYIKVELGEHTVGRYKFVRGDFIQAIIESDTHHAEQPFVPNLLAPGADIYAPTLSVNWDSLHDEWENREALEILHTEILRGHKAPAR